MRKNKHVWDMIVMQEELSPLLCIVLSPSLMAREHEERALTLIIDIVARTPVISIVCDSVRKDLCNDCLSKTLDSIHIAEGAISARMCRLWERELETNSSESKKCRRAVWPVKFKLWCRCYGCSSSPLFSLTSPLPLLLPTGAQSPRW